jgi:putative flippase GtrA
VKYNLVGIVNTLIGFSIIIGLMYVGFSATMSNMIGYAIGAVISYVLNSRYTFSSTSPNGNAKENMIKFFLILGVAYVLNFVTLQYLLTTLNPYLSQLGAAVVYTLSSFLMVRYFVFKDENE